MRSHSGGNTERLHGLTVVDTVVALVVLAFLVFGLLTPILAKTRSEATREDCAAHLASIGKAMLMYANDYNDALPHAAGRNAIWGSVVWFALTRGDFGKAGAYGLIGSDGAGGQCTISSCFYLLIKYAGAEPNMFLCGGDRGVSEFKLSSESMSSVFGITNLTQAWDFGSSPSVHCSYTYHSPWRQYALTTSDDPNMPVAADRNPYIVTPGVRYPKTFFNPNDPCVVFMGEAGSDACQMYGNSIVHEGEGQNVLYLDSHVDFKTRPFCGLEDDNIYTVSTFADKGDPTGIAPFFSPVPAGATPMNRKDSVLVHDPTTFAVPHR